MKYDLLTNAWYHKPGKTAILKYNRIPSNDNIWYSEYSYNGEEFSENSIYYHSEIKFIKYDKNIINLTGTSTSETIYLNYGKDYIYELNNPYSYTYNYTLTAFSEIQFNIYDYDMNLILNRNGYSINFLDSLPAGKCYLRVNFSRDVDCGYLNINFTYHNHIFGSPYTWVNYTQHRAKCSDCNITKLEGHVVANGSINGGLGYAPCLLCGGDAQVGFIQIQSIIKRSINGSYILSNGIIVLVEEDYNDFFKGNLNFFDSNIIELKV